MVSIPIGFSSSLQRRHISGSKGDGSVSIPIGFSSSLQRVVSSSTNVYSRLVSIPIGFSSSLQHHGRSHDHLAVDRFQSLSGFQVRCNVPPIGLQVSRKAVSIPIGFSSSLQQIDVKAACLTSNGFNPYRVFKFVATTELNSILACAGQFQSLSGFQVRCNLKFI